MSPHDRRPLQIYDPGTATLIAVARGTPGIAGGFECCEGNGALLAYYFGKGKREVLVRNGANEGVTARLATRWVADHREWILDW